MVKKLGFIVTACLLLLLYPGQAFAYNAADYFDDVKGHWALSAIGKWDQSGVLKGYDRKYRPDDPVTRAEMANILQRLLGYPASEESPYKDVAAGEWYARNVITLGKYGIVRDVDGYVRPNDPLSREEAMYMMAKAFGLPPVTEQEEEIAFADAAQFSSWALPYAQRMATMGFIKGRPDGSFAPAATITRAETVTIIDNMIDTWITRSSSDKINHAYKRVLITRAPITIVDHDADVFFIAADTSTGPVSIAAIPGKRPDVYLLAQNPEAFQVLNGTAEDFNIYYTSTDIRDIDNRFAGGSGTIADPYLISNQEQLALLNEYCFVKWSFLNFKLANDIKLSGQWQPIKGPPTEKINDPKNIFRATLDGDGHTISGLDIKVTVAASAPQVVPVGLFAELGRGCHVKNLNVAGRIQLAVAEGAISGEGRVSLVAGGLVGYMEGGLVENCRADVQIKAENADSAYAGALAGFIYSSLSTVRDCLGSGDIYASTRAGSSPYESAAAGGLAGGMAEGAKLLFSGADAQVTALGGFMAQAGGLLGSATHKLEGSISNSMMGPFLPLIEGCYATGPVTGGKGEMQNDIGGLIGYMDIVQVSRCWASGPVMSEGSPPIFHAMGSLVGACYDGGQISDCYALGEIKPNAGASLSAGGLVGRLGGVLQNSYAAIGTEYDLVGSTRDNGYAKNCFNLSEKIPATYPGWDFKEIWKNNGSGKLPTLNGVFEGKQGNP